MIQDVDSLKDRLCGNVYLDNNLGEEFVVVGINEESALALLQYEDGVAHDEIALPDLFSEDEAKKLGLKVGGIDSEIYEQVDSEGPTLDGACEDGNHDWSILPSDFGGDGIEYDRKLRCQSCSLSGEVLALFLGHFTPCFCCVCDSVVQNKDNVVVDDRNMYCEGCFDGQ